MKKLIILLVLSAMMFSASLSARYISPFKGQKEYLKKCRACHYGSSIFVQKYPQSFWKDMMANNGEKLIEIHKDLKRNQVEKEQNIGMIHEYFSSDRYKKKYKYLNAFVMRYAKDGAKSPTTGR